MRGQTPSRCLVVRASVRNGQIPHSIYVGRRASSFVVAVIVDGVFATVLPCHRSFSTAGDKLPLCGENFLMTVDTSGCGGVSSTTPQCRPQDDGDSKPVSYS